MTGSPNNNNNGNGKNGSSICSSETISFDLFNETPQDDGGKKVICIVCSIISILVVIALFWVGWVYCRPYCTGNRNCCQGKQIEDNPRTNREQTADKSKTIVSLNREEFIKRLGGGDILKPKIEKFLHEAGKNFVEPRKGKNFVPGYFWRWDGSMGIANNQEKNMITIVFENSHERIEYETKLENPQKLENWNLVLRKHLFGEGEKDSEEESETGTID